MWDMINTSHDQDVFVVAMARNWMGAGENQQLAEKISTELKNGGKSIVLDLEMVKWMNSSGLGALISVLTLTREAGAKLALAAVPKEIYDLLHVTSMNTLFTIYKTRHEAIQAVK